MDDNEIYFVLKDAGCGKYELLRGRETVVDALIEAGYLDGSAAEPKLTEKGRAARDVLGEIGVIAERISVREFNKYTMDEMFEDFQGLIK